MFYEAAPIKVQGWACRNQKEGVVIIIINNNNSNNNNDSNNNNNSNNIVDEFEWHMQVTPNAIVFANKKQTKCNISSNLEEILLFLQILNQRRCSNYTLRSYVLFCCLL